MPDLCRIYAEVASEVAGSVQDLRKLSKGISQDSFSVSAPMRDLSELIADLRRIYADFMQDLCRIYADSLHELCRIYADSSRI